MGLLALGVHYQSTPIEIREQFAFVGSAACEISRCLVQEGCVAEALMVCTCHRTELYCYTEDPISNALEMSILERLAQNTTLRRADLMPYVYAYTDLAAINHIIKVASGLESMVLGEAEIFGQMKRAYTAALHAGTIGKVLNRLFQTTFANVKHIRSKTNIGSNPVSIGFMAAKLIEHKMTVSTICPTKLCEAKVLLIGAGEIIRLTALHLQKLGVVHWAIANRTTDLAQTLANQLQATVISWDELVDHLGAADVVITATSSAVPIVKQSWIEKVLKYKRNLLLLDLAVPRDIEPIVGTLPGVSLYTVDDLRGTIEENLNIRKESAQVAKEIIHTQAKAFMDSLRVESVKSLIRTFRDTMEQSRDEALSEALRKLKAGQCPEMVLKRLAFGLTNQWLHHPTQRLKQAGLEEDESSLIFTRELFGLTECVE